MAPNIITDDNNGDPSIPTTIYDDIVYANGGDDTIIASFGYDIYYGGSGSDTVSFRDSGGVVGDLNTGEFFSDGEKLLISIENIVGSSTSDTIIGNALNNNISGGYGVDILHGGLGDDTIRAGGGRSRDVLMGGPGDDTLINNSIYGGAVASYQLATGAVFVDTYLGVSHGADGDDNIKGIDEILGSTHADTLIAGTNGILHGGSGADTLSVSSSVRATSWLYGDNDNDTLYGGRGTTYLDGGRGVDFLYAGTGQARMSGGIGNDTLVAGDSVDTMAGGSGMDRFVFRAASDIDAGLSSYDQISDFSRSEKDKIDLASIDANPYSVGDQSFKFVGTASFTAVGQIAYESWSSSGASGIRILLNLDNDSSTEARFVLLNQASITGSDFIL